MYNRASFTEGAKVILAWLKRGMKRMKLRGKKRRVRRGAVLFKRSVSRGVYPRERRAYTSSIPSPFSSSQSVSKIKVGDYELEPITSGVIRHPESAGDGI